MSPEWMVFIRGQSTLKYSMLLNTDNMAVVEIGNIKRKNLIKFE